MSEEFSTAQFKRTDTDHVERSVRAERARQLAKWGPQTHANGTSHEAWHHHTEEARSAWERARETGAETWQQILMEEVLEVFECDEDDLENMYAELIQVAAVTKAWLVDIYHKRAAQQ